mgnify:CR=1 FL=1
MYTVCYHCCNCNHSQSNRFEKGVKAPETVKCKKCGCVTAEKTWISEDEPYTSPKPWKLPEPYEPKKWVPDYTLPFDYPAKRLDYWCEVFC